MDIYTPYIAPKAIDNRFASQDTQRLKEQTDNFEAMFVQMFLDKALASDEGLFPKQAGSDIYKSMYVETMSKGLAGNFGFSELLFNHLTEK